MDNNDLMSLLESLLGPAVAGIHAPTPRAHASRQTGAPRPAAAGAPGPVGTSTGQGSVTALLSAETPVGLAVLDAATLQVNRANAPFVTMLGHHLTDADVLGHALQQVAPGFANSEVEAAFLRVVRTGTPFSAIVEEATPQGSIYRRCTLSTIRRADGSCAELLLTILDVTDQMEARHRADVEARRAEEKAAHVEEQALRTSVRAAAMEALARVSDLHEALSRVAERTAESLGDCCAVFLLGEDDILQVAALYHRDRAKGFGLRSLYTEHPERRGQGVIGRVVLAGNGYLAARWSPSDSAAAIGPHQAALEAAHVESLLCVPLREASRSFGAVLLFATQSAFGGSGRGYTGADLHFLQELADQVAQTVQNVRLREALRAAQVEKETLLEASGDGIALYDAQGRLRHLNSAGRQLLTRPQLADPRAAPPGPTSRRTLLTLEGRPLEPEQLPWARALRGEQVGVGIAEGMLVEWDGNLRRTLSVRATPMQDGSGTIYGAVVIMMDAALRSADPFADGADTLSAAPSSAAAEWARWRETMELFADGVVLCDASGTVVFVNVAGRELLHLPDAEPADQQAPGDVWTHLRRPDGAALATNEDPATLALAGDPVQELETAVVLPDGALRRVFWDARRIDGDQGAALGVVLIARLATDATPGGEAIEPAQVPPTSSPAPLAPPLAPTTLLPHRPLAEQATPPPSGHAGCDLAEVCARVARAHGGAQGRRLEIRLPRRQVIVAGQESVIFDATHALIASGAAALPASAPLHVAVWVERGPHEQLHGPRALIPPAVDVTQLHTVHLQPGQTPEQAAIAAPTRAVSFGTGGAQASVAVVRVCSPGLGTTSIDTAQPMEEPPAFVRCRDLVAQVGGRAWARRDPLLGPTYSFSLPLADAE